MSKFKVMWETKDGRTIEDVYTFDSEEEAGTYIGIEMTQIETEEVKNYHIVPVEWYVIENMPINIRQIDCLKNSLKVHIDLLQKAGKEKISKAEIDEVVRNHDACMTLLHIIDNYLKVM